MKQDIRGLIFAVILVPLLCFGVYWGVSVAPKKEKYWATVNSVSAVSGASISLDGKTIIIYQSDAEQIFKFIQASSNYSPNHPNTIREGMITFKTDKGDISFKITETNNQGVLLWAYSSGDTGWNYGSRRCDDLTPFLILGEKQQARQTAADKP